MFYVKSNPLLFLLSLSLFFSVRVPMGTGET